MGQKQSGLTPKKIACLSKETHFSQNEIITWYQGTIYSKTKKKRITKKSLAASQPSICDLKISKKGFMKDCPTGKLSRNEFIRIYIQFFPHGNPSDFARFVFKTFDKDNDGTICFAEFIRAVSITSHGSLG